MTDKEKILLVFAILESTGLSSRQFTSKSSIQNALSQFESYFHDVTTVEGFLEKNSHFHISAENVTKAHEAYSESPFYTH